MGKPTDSLNLHSPYVILSMDPTCHINFLIFLPTSLLSLCRRLAARGSGELARRRRGQGWGKRRGGRAEPVGGIGVREYGRRRPVRGGRARRRRVLADGAAPAALGGGGRASEHQWTAGNQFRGSIWVENDRNGGSTYGQGRGGTNGAGGGSGQLRRGWEGGGRLGSFSNS